VPQDAIVSNYLQPTELITSIPSFPSNVIVLDEKTMAVIKYQDERKTIEKCTLYDLDARRDKLLADEILQKGKSRVEQSSFKQMLTIIDKCRSLTTYDLNLDGEIRGLLNVTELRSLWNGIVPGTKWCGLGTSAKGYHDLGQKAEVDSCCRAHDLCPVRLRAFRMGYGLVNLSLYTKSHCECDADFQRCLKGSNSPTADIIGNLYFNVMKIDCIAEQQKSALRSNCVGSGNGSNCVEGRSSRAPMMTFYHSPLEY